ncbi:MBL fold metallo-hydrolase [Pelagivirga sediminicola]|uniref:MBL fold metallo-hydrolase n=1 Tax=Pelagivirga sediminicola TaxID=2170575 RepID=A0A2T7G9Q4_9RHOB|nr:MBL fold metallo-hydrolase [Pelagivirga sediminicola]PVA11157.1 MBL fold metallo-hydrolase [Pelagivirga sediminicola]
MRRHTLSRRALLGAAAALPLAHAARAAAPMMGPSSATHRRIALGDFEITNLLAGTAPREDPHSIFGLNVDDDTFAEVARDALLPTEVAQFFFTPTLVNTGETLVLFDTGLDPAGLTEALSGAGYSADQVDIVVITHMHGDHIGGLMGADGATFANARYVTGAAEFDHWAAAENDGFEAKMRPLAEQTTMIEPGQDAAPGITAVEAFGHTPGHMAYRIESAGKSLLIGADFANHPVFSLAHPDWEVSFDMDKSAAAATRHALLDMLAAERMPFIGYHMPFPAMGYVKRTEGGYAYLPESYQLRL